MKAVRASWNWPISSKTINFFYIVYMSAFKDGWCTQWIKHFYTGLELDPKALELSDSNQPIENWTISTTFIFDKKNKDTFYNQK